MIQQAEDMTVMQDSFERHHQRHAGPHSVVVSAGMRHMVAADHHGGAETGLVEVSVGMRHRIVGHGGGLVTTC